MTLRPLFGVAALFLALSGPPTALAETWTETGHYKMQVDTDSIHKGADGLVYFVWKTTQEGMIVPPQHDAFDCNRRLHYADRTIPGSDAPGAQIGFHTMIDRLLDFVCAR